MEVLRDDIETAIESFENYADKPKKKLRTYVPFGASAPSVLHLNGEIYIHKKHKKYLPTIIANMNPETLKMNHPDHWFGSSWGAKIKNRIKKIGDGIGDALKAAAFSPLLPFKNMMRSALQKKGLKPSGKFGDMALQFFNEVVKKHGHYEESPNHLLPLAIIPPIIAFIKDALAKKKAGAKLTPEESLAADAAQTTLAKVEQQAAKAGVNLQDQASIEAAITKGKVKDDSNAPSGFSLSMPMMLGIGGGIVVLILVLAMRK